MSVTAMKHVVKMPGTIIQRYPVLLSTLTLHSGTAQQHPLHCRDMTSVGQPNMYSSS